MVGVVVEMADEAPTRAKLREITKVMEFAPALTPKLIELAQWIAIIISRPLGKCFDHIAAGDGTECASRDFFDGSGEGRGRELGRR